MKITRLSKKPLIKSEEFILEDVFPTHEISLIAGASGAGKTTWLMQMIDAWKKGEKVCGLESYPRPFIYISLDRSAKSCKHVFERTKVDSDDWDIITLDKSDSLITMPQIVEAIAKQRPDVKVLFIEGFATRVPQGKLGDYSTVANYLLELRGMCEKHGITIVGVVHRAKTKEGEEYKDMREKVLGSVGWGAYAEGLVYIEQIGNGGADSPLRDLWFLPRNSKNRKFKMVFEDGRLSPYEEKSKNEVAVWNFVRIAPGVFSPKQIVEKTGMSESSVHVELKKLLEKDRVRKTDMLKGGYVFVPDVLGDAAPPVGK